MYEIKNYKSKNIYKIYLYIKSNVENYKKKKTGKIKIFFSYKKKRKTASRQKIIKIKLKYL